MIKILIIDDNDKFREVLREALTQAGYKVLEASNGSDGIDLYRREYPDLVITDVIMPAKSGTQVIFELEKDFPDINIFAVSGGGKGSARDYLKGIASFTDVKHTFEKPFAMNELLQAVKEVVG